MGGAPAATFAMVPIDEYERLKKDAASANFWRDQEAKQRHRTSEAYRVAIAALLGAGGELRVSRMDLDSVERDPEKWDLRWASYDGVNDPLGQNLVFAVRKKWATPDPSAPSPESAE